MEFDWTINLTAVILTVVSLLIAPIVHLLGRTLLELRDTVRELGRDIGQDNPPSGIKGAIVGLRREEHKHRNWLIQLYQHVGLPWSDRG